MGSPLLEVRQKPAVIFSVLGQVPDPWILALEHGLEEEQIPCEREELEQADAVRAASRAAKTSRINVGLSMGGTPVRAVLHHRDLPEDRPVFILDQEALSQDSLYRLGRNAARLVKGNPFIRDGNRQTEP